MKVAIVGSRTVTDYAVVETVMQNYSGVTQVVSGGAKGVDSLAEKWSSQQSLQNPLVFKPDWATHGRGAGVVRNRAIVDAADIVVAIWDGESRGTLSSIKYGIKQGKQVDVWVEFNNKWVKIPAP